MPLDLVATISINLVTLDLEKDALQIGLHQSRRDDHLIADTEFAVAKLLDGLIPGKDTLDYRKHASFKIVEQAQRFSAFSKICQLAILCLLPLYCPSFCGQIFK